jgi:hypothetical protein
MVANIIEPNVFKRGRAGFGHQLLATQTKDAKSASTPASASTSALLMCSLLLGGGQAGSLLSVATLQLFLERRIIVSHHQNPL